MTEPSRKNADKKSAIPPAEDLGISKSLYALGVSTWKALVSGTVVTALMIAGFGFGHKNPYIAKAADFIEKTHSGIKSSLKEAVTAVAAKLGIKADSELFKIKPAETAAALVAGYAVSHLAQVSGGVTGYRQAQNAIDKHAAVVAENKQLRQENLTLAESNVSFRAALGQQDASFTDRVVKQSAEPEAGTARS